MTTMTVKKLRDMLAMEPDDAVVFAIYQGATHSERHVYKTACAADDSELYLYCGDLRSREQEKPATTEMLSKEVEKIQGELPRIKTVVGGLIDVIYNLEITDGEGNQMCQHTLAMLEDELSK